MVAEMLQEWINDEMDEHFVGIDALFLSVNPVRTLTGRREQSLIVSKSVHRSRKGC